MGLINDDFDVCLSDLPIEYWMQDINIELLERLIAPRMVMYYMPDSYNSPDKKTMPVTFWRLPELFFGVHQFQAETVTIEYNSYCTYDDVKNLIREQVSKCPDVIAVTPGKAPDLSYVSNIWDPRPGWEGIKHHTPFYINKIETPNDHKKYPRGIHDEA